MACLEGMGCAWRVWRGWALHGVTAGECGLGVAWVWAFAWRASTILGVTITRMT